MHPINSPLFGDYLGFCSLPGRNKQYEKMVTISWPKMALVPAGETGQQDFLTIHFNLENIYVMPLNSPSHLGMPIKREVGEQAVQFGGFPKAALNKSSPYPPGLGSTVRVLPLYVGQHRLVQKEGESPFYR